MWCGGLSCGREVDPQRCRSPAHMLKGMSKTRPSSILAGVAGEYLVAGELSRRGWIASLTLRNTRGVDILVTSEGLDRSVGIQVKTRRDSKPEWMLNKKAETMAHESLFYAFVRLMDGEVPQYHLVPSAVVAEHTERTHREWLATPGRRGQARKDGPIRNFADPEFYFLDRWELLGLD
jgi:hypothetical protein